MKDGGMAGSVDWCVLLCGWLGRIRLELLGKIIGRI